MYERHLYIIGKSGTGKSTFLQNTILQNAGGFCLLDPHGDLAEAIADTIDCIYFDPSELQLGFNVFENVPEPSRPLVAAQIVASFKAVWGDSWGPRMEWILVNSLRLLLDNNQTFLGLSKLLIDDRYRNRLFQRCTDSIAQAFWHYEFDAYDDRFRKEANRAHTKQSWTASRKPDPAQHRRPTAQYTAAKADHGPRPAARGEPR